MAKIKKKAQKKKEWLSKFLYGLSLVFLAVGLYQLAWAVWPSPLDGVQLSIPKGALGGAPPGTTYASPSDYSLELSWPRWLRGGQKGKLQLVLREIGELDSDVDTESTLVVLMEPVFPNLSVTPPGRIQANLGPGQSLDLDWDIQGEVEGAYPGKLYATFGFFDETADEMVLVPVAVVDMTVRVISLLGMERNLAIWFGLVALALWGALFVLGRFVQLRNLVPPGKVKK